MTISSETRKAGPFPGNGVTTAFPFAFKVFTASDLAVTLNVLATGVQTMLTLTSDYTVTLNPDQNANPGGTVTYNPSGIPMPSTKTLTIGSALTNTQGYQPTNSGGWLPSNAGDAWDRAVILIQQVSEKVTRSLKFPIVDGALNPELPPAAQRANNLLGFDASGNAIAVAPAAQSATALQTLLALSSGASLIGWIQSGTGAVLRLVQDKLRDTVSVKDFGAKVDGVTDDTAAVTAANSAGGTITVPTGLASTTLTSATLSANFTGPGQLKTGVNKRGKYFSAINAAPSSLGNEGGIETAFNGDWSHSNFSIEHRINGAATLGQPATGYMYTPEACAHYTHMYNSSGWNQDTAGNGGRTAAVAHRIKVFQAGQGDAVAFNAGVFVTGTRAGSTHWLANPAGVLFNGGMSAGADGVYLNPYETICDDGGFDVACIGTVNNFLRSNATGAKSTVWNGYRAQSGGTASCDAIISATGKWQTGLDLSMSSLDFGANKAAISLKVNDRIYFNNNAFAAGNLGADWRTTGFNGDYMTYSNSINGLVFVLGGTGVFQITNSQTTVSNAFRHTGTSLGFFNAAVTGQQGGWGTPTGNAVIANFPGGSATLLQCSQTIAQIVTNLKAYGLYGA